MKNEDINRRRTHCFIRKRFRRPTTSAAGRPGPVRRPGLTPPLIVARHGGIADDTCKMQMMTVAGTTEIDPVFVGEQLVKAGEYRLNPFARFGGHGTTWAHIDGNQCLAAAGKIAAAYGIQRVYVYHDGSDEVAVSLPHDYVFDGYNAGPYTDEFINFTPNGGADGSVHSTLRFHNVSKIQRDEPRRELQHVIRRDRHLGGPVRIWQRPASSMAMCEVRHG